MSNLFSSHHDTGIDDTQPASGDQTSEIEWEVWHRDTFDHSSNVDARGRGLIEGLRELWTRHLFEHVGENGVRGFSTFSLWEKDMSRAIAVIEDWGEQLIWDGAVRLRGWVFDKHRDRKDGDPDLLNHLALHHAHLLHTEKPSMQILRIAGTSMSREEFEQRLEELHAETDLHQKTDGDGEGNKANLQEVCEFFGELHATYPDIAARYNIPTFLRKVAELAAEAGHLGEATPDLDERISKLHQEASSIFQALNAEIAANKLMRKLFMDVVK
jgi:hypothetical protein